METHLTACSACREELEALSVTQTALLAVREEEPPRRIAFISDKVFAPNWWHRLSGAKLGFASAAMLSAAIIFHAVETRAAQPAPVASAQHLDQAKVEAEVTRRVQAKLEKVLAESESRQSVQLQQVLADQRRMEFNHKADLVTLGENFDVLRKRLGVYMRASNDAGVGQ